MTTKTATEDGIGQRIHDAADRLVDLEKDIATNVDRQVKSLRTLVKQHPIAALAVALGAGYLLARLVHR
jgi:ElaB/YqjD/DUF883 family membrane-anchored ribosome-binding protein